MATQTPLRIDAGDRVGLPRALRTETPFDAGAKPVAFIAGAGQILLQTRAVAAKNCGRSTLAVPAAGPPSRTSATCASRTANAPSAARRNQTAADGAGSARQCEKPLRTLGL